MARFPFSDQMLLHSCIFVACLQTVASATVTVPLAFSCEFQWEPCCQAALAGAQLGLLDSNTKVGTLIPELATTTKDIQLEISTVIDSSSKPTLVNSLRSAFAGAAPPVALIGSYYSSRVSILGQFSGAMGLSNIAWCSSPIFDGNNDFASVFRVIPADSRNMLGLHAFMKLRKLTKVGIVYNLGDAWCLGLVDTLRKACAAGSSSGHACEVTLYGLPYAPSQELVDATVLQLQGSGLRTIVQAIVTGSEQDQFQNAAHAKGMIGDAKSAEGYVWLFPWLPIGAVTNSQAFKGAIAATRAHDTIKGDKVTAFAAHWKAHVPFLEMKSVPGQWLSVGQSKSPGSCSYLAGAAYDSIARARLALENVDLSKPSKPVAGPYAGAWWGTELRKQLQSPGTTMNGLLQGPNLRSSTAAGLPWVESTATFILANFVDTSTQLTVFDAQAAGSTYTLSEAADYAQGTFAGKISFSSKVPVGQLESTTCNLDKASRCRNSASQGSCQLVRHLPGFLDGGWCKCDNNYAGRFCTVKGITTHAPMPVVPVRISLKVVEFGGLSNSGDAFAVGLRRELTWTDIRIPWDAGTYNGADAEKLLQQIWTPFVGTTGSILKSSGMKLTVQRDVVAEEQNYKESAVNLTWSITYSISQGFAPNFEDFPFDHHSVDVKFSSQAPEVELILSGGDSIFDVEPEVMEAWSNQWPADRSDGDWAYVRSVDTGKAFRVHFGVKRSSLLTIFRLILPMTLLVFMSWSGFFIRPGALMPRFASGFISFLSLQAFKTYAVKMMPNDGKINSMSWIDTYISIVGFLMVLAVGETVLTQYVCENISRTVAVSLDQMARIVFPLTYAITFIVLCLPLNSNQTLVTAHTVLVIAIVGYGCITLHEALFWPRLYLKRNINKSLSGAKRHQEHNFTRHEKTVFFELLEKQNSKLAKSGASPGFVAIDALHNWLLSAQPHLKEHEDGLRSLIISIMGTDHTGGEFSFPTFEHELCHLINQVTLLLHGHIVHDPSSNGLSDNSHCRSTVINVEAGLDRAGSTVINVEAGLGRAGHMHRHSGTFTQAEDEDDEEEEEERQVVTGKADEHHPHERHQAKSAASKTINVRLPN